MSKVGAVLVGIVAGRGIFSAAFYVWMIFGADPDKDPLLSW